MIDDPSESRFGCERCWPASPDAAWQARSALARVAELIDESHFHAMVLACDVCAQQFASVFAETVDWVDGQDPQYWTLLPLTGAEASRLTREGTTSNEAQLNALGPGRRSLRRDHPKSAPPRTYWDTGIVVGPHD